MFEDDENSEYDFDEQEVFDQVQEAIALGNVHDLADLLENLSDDQREFVSDMVEGLDDDSADADLEGDEEDY